MLYAVRPPKYNDDDNPDSGGTGTDESEKDERNPRMLYFGLLAYHFIYAFFSYCEAFTAWAK